MGSTVNFYHLGAGGNNGKDLAQDFFFFLVTLHGIWAVSSLTRDCIYVPCSRSAESYHWTTKEVCWLWILAIAPEKELKVLDFSD